MHGPLHGIFVTCMKNYACLYNHDLVYLESVQPWSIQWFKKINNNCNIPFFRDYLNWMRFFWILNDGNIHFTFMPVSMTLTWFQCHRVTKLFTCIYLFKFMYIWSSSMKNKVHFKQCVKENSCYFVCVYK